MTLPSAHQGRILIIDSSSDLHWFIAKIFQPKGYEVLSVATGMEGLKQIQEFGKMIDLIILDPEMPGMGGLEMLKALRRMHPGITILVLSAAEKNREECLSLGVEAFMTKPYSVQDLYQRVDAVMDRQLLDKSPVNLDPNIIPSARILIVDDEQQVCELLSEALYEDSHGADFKVMCATSGEEGLRVSEEFKPDLAIVDMRMPRMWGDELINRFKSGEGHCPRDFIIYTSITEPREIEGAKKLGHKFIAKPTDLDILLEVIIKLCVKHHLLKKIAA